MKKRFFQIALAAVLSVSCVITGVNVNAASLSQDGYNIEKVSHTDRGAGETDGILPFDIMGEENNRNQSYVWSSVEYGNYIYLGTCWNPISGIYYRNLKNNLTSLFEKRGDENPAQKAGTVATNILNVVYNGNFPDGATSTTGTPCIMRVNKYTYDAEVVYIEKESSRFVNWNGYRMATEYNGKLYFACAGYPTSRLLQIDPATNETKVVLQKTAENSGFANGIRGLTVMDGKLFVSLATDGADPDNMFASGSQLPQAYKDAISAMAKKDVRYKDDNPRMEGVRLLSTTNPEDVDSWTVIANQETFDNLPACWIRDSINGGGLWDLVPFNGSLYASMVTGKTDPTTGVTHKQGFAVYRGDPYPAYTIWLPVKGKHEIDLQQGYIAAKKIPAFVEDYLRDVIAEQANYADYYDYVAKRGVNIVKELIAKYKEVAPYSEEPDTFFDFGDDEKFSLIKYGKAECSAGLFDIIEIDQDTIREKRKEVEQLLGNIPQGVPADLQSDGKQETSKIEKLLHDIVFSENRMLLVTRGLDPRTDEDVYNGFEKEFIAAGIIPQKFKVLTDKARNNESLIEQKPLIDELADLLNDLYQNMDDSLQFKLPAVQSPTDFTDNTDSKEKSAGQKNRSEDEDKSVSSVKSVGQRNRSENEENLCHL